MQTLVRRMRIALRVFDPEKQRRRSAKQIRKRPDKADRAAAADRHRLLLEPRAHRIERRLECRTSRVGHPPLYMAAIRLHRDLHAPRWIFGQDGLDLLK